MKFKLSGRGGGFAQPSLVASAVDGSSGAMVALYPTPPQADALAIEGGQPAGELHVTLVYLGKASDVDLAKVEDALGADLGKPLAGETGEPFQFSEGEDGTPLNVSPEVPGLEDFRAEVLRRLEAAGIEDASSHPDWVPHICLGYGNDPSEAEAKVGLPLSFDSVAVVVGDDRTNVPLTASVDASPADRWDALAREIEAEIEQEPVTASAARGHDPMWGVLRLAAEEVETARLREAEALASRSREDRGAMREMFAAMRHLADRKPGDTHITMPATELHPHVTIHEPPITIEAAPTPDVNVSVEPVQVTVEAAPTPTVEFRPEITVQPPNVEAPNVEVAAPEVYVTLEQPPRPGSIRAIKDDDGSTVFTVEPEYEEE